MIEFIINVRYRTNSGCNAKTVRVMASNIEEAMRLASDRVRRMRGVVKIDGGDWNMPIGDGWFKYVGTP